MNNSRRFLVTLVNEKAAYSIKRAYFHAQKIIKIKNYLPEKRNEVMDAMRHVAAIRMWEYLHRKKLLGKRNASRKKGIPEEQFLVYRFLIKPTKEQERFLRQSAGNCRFLWSQMLNDFKTTGSYQTPSAYKKKYNFLTVSDNGWGMFVDMLLYKAARKGKLVLFVSK